MKQNIKRFICVLICLAMVLPMVPVVGSADGFVASITSEEEFLAIMDNPNGSYRLEADLNLGEIVPLGYDPDNGWLTSFGGYLDGNGHTVRYSARFCEGLAYYGLFAKLAGTGRITNLRVDGDLDLDLGRGYYGIGAVAGACEYGAALTNLYVDITMDISSNAPSANRVSIGGLSCGGDAHSCSVNSSIRCAVSSEQVIYYDSLGTNNAYFCSVSGDASLSGRVNTCNLLYFASDSTADVSLNLYDAPSCYVVADANGKRNQVAADINVRGITSGGSSLEIYGLQYSEGSTLSGSVTTRTNITDRVTVIGAKSSAGCSVGWDIDVKATGGPGQAELYGLYGCTDSDMSGDIAVDAYKLYVGGIIGSERCEYSGDISAEADKYSTVYGINGGASGHNVMQGDLSLSTGSEEARVYVLSDDNSAFYGDVSARSVSNKATLQILACDNSIVRGDMTADSANQDSRVVADGDNCSFEGNITAGSVSVSPTNSTIVADVYATQGSVSIAKKENTYFRGTVRADGDPGCGVSVGQGANTVSQANVTCNVGNRGECILYLGSNESSFSGSGVIYGSTEPIDVFTAVPVSVHHSIVGSWNTDQIPYGVLYHLYDDPCSDYSNWTIHNVQEYGDYYCTINGYGDKWFTHWMSGIDVTHYDGRSTADCAAGWDGSVDPDTGDYQPELEPRDYTLRLVDINREPMPNAFLVLDGQSYPTNSKGCAEIKNGPGIIRNLQAQLYDQTTGRYETVMTMEEFYPIPDKVNTVQLEPDFSMTLNFLEVSDAEKGSGSFSLPGIETSGLLVDGLNFPLNFDMQKTLGEQFSFGPRIDPDTGELSVILTSSLGSGGKHPAMSWEKYTALRDLMLYPNFADLAFSILDENKAVKAKMGILDWDVSLIGLAEFDYDADQYGWVFREGAFGLQSYLEKRYVVPIVAVPGAYWTAALRGELSSTLGGEIGDTSSGEAAVRLVGTVEPSLRVEGGLGYGVRAARLYLELGVGGEIEAEIQAPLVGLEESFSATGSFDVFGEVGLLGFVNRVELAKVSVSWPQADTYALRRSVEQAISTGEFELAPRTYANSVQRKTRAVGENAAYMGLNDENCYPYSNVRLQKLSNGKYLLLYTDDDLSRGAADRSALRACIGTVVDGNLQWGESVTVDPDGTGDFGFAVDTLKTKAAVVWQDADKTFGNGQGLTTEELAGSITLSQAVLDCSGEVPVVTETAVVAPGGSFPYYPVVFYNGYGIRTGWVTTDNPDPVRYLEGEKEAIHLSTAFGKAGSVVAADQSSISGLTLSENSVMWSCDEGEETALYALDSGKAVREADRGNIRNLQYNNKRSYYTKDDAIYINADTHSNFQFRAAGPGYEGTVQVGADYVAYSAQSGRGQSTIYQVDKTANLPIAEYEGFLTSWDACDGHIVSVVRSGFNDTDSAAFTTQLGQEIKSVYIRAFTADASNAGTITVSAQFVNEGYRRLDSVPVTVTTADGTLVASGEILTMTDPGQAGSGVVTLEAGEFPAGEPLIVTVAGESRTVETVTHNLGITAGWYPGSAGEVTVNVVNTGTEAAEGTVTVSDGDEILYTETLALQAGENRKLRCDLGRVYDYEAILQVTLEEAEGALTTADNRVRVRTRAPEAQSVLIQVPDLSAGQESALTLIPMPEGSPMPAVTYAVADESIASVDASGRITAIADGETELTVTMEDGKTFTVKLTVAGQAHSYGPYVSDNNASCGKDGTKSAVCTECGHVNTVTDPGSALSHNWSAWKNVQPSSCTGGGIDERSCSRCGETEQNYLPWLDHDYHAKVTKPSCTGGGFTRHTCSVCGASYDSDPVDPKGHSYRTEVTEPSCTGGGFTRYTCSVCGYNYDGDEVSPKGHLWSEWEVTKAATVTSGGEEKRYCERCSHEESRKTLPLDYPFVDVEPGRFYETPVLWAVENGITNGVDATHFGPEQICNRAQVVTFLWRASGSPEPVSDANPFVDVQPGTFYYKAVLWAVEEGITNGVDANHFGAQQECTRGHVATFLWRTLEKPAPGGSNPFTDVAAGRFYYDAVLWAVENGITNGMTATTFAPDTSCTRGQIVTFLYRALG